MARVEHAPEVADDFERILAHLEQFQVENPTKRIDEIISAIAVLANNPLIGRPDAAGKRELVIGKQAHGYVTLYSDQAELNSVFVLAIRSQPEASVTGF